MDRSGGAVMAWNVFKYCTALRALGSVMIILVLCLVGFTYYAVVLANYGPALFDGGLDSFTAFAILVLFHALLAMLLWSYFAVVLTDPGGVPPNWTPKIDEERCDADPLVESAYIGPSLASNDLSVLGESANQRIRWEVYSENGPPLHLGCKLCGRIELQFYTFLETTLVTLSLLPYFMAFFSDVEISGTPTALAASFIAFVLNLAFALSIMGFMIMHLSLVASNTTTIEAFEKKTSAKWYYDLGFKENYEQVFGTNKRYWLIPAYSDEDLRGMPVLQGLEYPSVPDVEALQEL